MVMHFFVRARQCMPELLTVLPPILTQTNHNKYRGIISHELIISGQVSLTGDYLIQHEALLYTTTQHTSLNATTGIKQKERYFF